MRSLWKKVRLLEKRTPPPVVAAVTIMRYGYTLQKCTLDPGHQPTGVEPWVLEILTHLKIKNAPWKSFLAAEMFDTMLACNWYSSSSLLKYWWNETFQIFKTFQIFDKFEIFEIFKLFDTMLACNWTSNHTHHHHSHQRQVHHQQHCFRDFQEFLPRVNKKWPIIRPKC